jgi:hypothetical protein
VNAKIPSNVGLGQQLVTLTVGTDTNTQQAVTVVVQ